MTSDADWMSIGPYDSPILETTMSAELKTVIEKLKMLRDNAEERISKLQKRREEDLPQMEDILYGAGLLAWKEEVEIFSDAITLLESTGKDAECTCETFQRAWLPKTSWGGDAPLVHVFQGKWAVGSLCLPPIRFCPWCGNPPKAPEAIAAAM